MALAAGSAFFLIRFVRKKYLFFKNGFRTTATVVEVVKHHGGRMIEFGYVPIVRFKSRTGKVIVFKTDFFLERFVTNPKLEVGYEFEIIYEDHDLKNMMEYRTLKGLIIMYLILTLFPVLLFLGLLAGLFY